jgi:hypothetical protein
MFYTYAHYRKNDDSGLPFYIGKGSGKRAFVRRRTAYWKNIVAKNGLRVDILCSWPSEEDAFIHEKVLIEIFKSMGACECNLTKGGEGPSGMTHSEQVKQRMREKHTGVPLSNSHKLALQSVWAREEVKEKHRAALLRSWDNPERRAKQSQIQKQLKSTEEARQHMKEISKKCRQNPEINQKIIAACKAALTGKKKSATHIAALRAVKAKPVICIETGVWYPTATEAIRAIKQNASTTSCTNITNVCKGKQKKAYGFTWMYANAEQPMKVDVTEGRVTVTKGDDQVTATK